MLLTCFSTAPSPTNSAAAIRRVRTPLRHELQHLALSPGEGVQRVATAGPSEQLGDHLGVQGRASVRDSAYVRQELAHVGDAVLEQVADAAGLPGEQLGGVALLDVLRQHEYGDVGPRRADHESRTQPLVRVGRRHAYVGHDDVRLEVLDRAQEVLGVGHRRDDLMAVLGKQASQAFAQQGEVLGDHDTHGSST